jgi:hypothetical protein
VALLGAAELAGPAMKLALVAVAAVVVRAATA